MADVNLTAAIKKGSKATNASSAKSNAKQGKTDIKNIAKYLSGAKEAKTKGAESRAQINSKIKELLTGANQTVSAAAPSVSEGLANLKQSGGLVGVDIASQAEESTKNNSAEQAKSGQNAAKNINIGLVSPQAAAPAVDNFNGNSAIGNNNATGTTGTTPTADTTPKAEATTTANEGSQTQDAKSSKEGPGWSGNDGSNRSQQYDKEGIEAQQRNEEIQAVSNAQAAQNNGNKPANQKSGSGMITTKRQAAANKQAVGNNGTTNAANTIAGNGQNNDALNAIKEAVRSGDSQTQQDLSQIKNLKTQMANNSSQVQKSQSSAEELVNKGTDFFNKFVNAAQEASSLVGQGNTLNETAAELFDLYESLKDDPTKAAEAAAKLAAAQANAGNAFNTITSAVAKETSAISDGVSAFNNFDNAKATLTNAQTQYAQPQTGLASNISNLSNKIKSDNAALYEKVQSEVAKIKNGNNGSTGTTPAIAQSINNSSNGNNNSSGIKFGLLSSGQSAQFGLA